MFVVVFSLQLRFWRRRTTQLTAVVEALTQRLTRNLFYSTFSYVQSMLFSVTLFAVVSVIGMEGLSKKHSCFSD